VTTTPGDPAVFAGSTAQVQITERRPAHPDASPVDRYVEGRDPQINRAFARSLIHGAEPARGNLA
jgi:hypothetical protein